MKVTFLGTGTSTGVPVIACNCPVCISQNPRDKRFRSSIMIEMEGSNFIIDCGPDFRFQMLKHRVDNIDAILFTHEHRDHIAGLDDIRAFNYILNKTIDIYGTEDVITAIKTEFPYIFTETRFFGAPQINIHKIDSDTLEINGVKITVIHAMHNKMPVIGFRINDFSYITDANYISPEEIKKLENSKIIVINALRNSKHVSHFSLGEAIEIIKELKPDTAYITHISHFLGLHDEVNLRLPENIRLAHDNLVIQV
ncbi:MAG: MBL fold metallo-hydrolase [Bacteroidota bacterium]